MYLLWWFKSYKLVQKLIRLGTFFIIASQVFMGIEDNSVYSETSSEEGPKSKAFVFSLTLLSPRNYLVKA